MWRQLYEKYKWDAFIPLPLTERAFNSVKYPLFSVSIEWMWDFIVEDLADAGVVGEKKGNIVKLSYKLLPEIWAEISVRGEFYRDGVSFCATELHKKLVAKYGTPYPEEVAILRIISRLPSTITAAIADCIHAVMERRFDTGFKPAFQYSSREAHEAEVYYTHGRKEAINPNQKIGDWETLDIVRWLDDSDDSSCSDDSE
jgi:hypothetical protein